MELRDSAIFNLVQGECSGNPISYVRNIVKPISYNVLNEQIKGCKDCALCNNTKHLISGNPYASILIIKDSSTSDIEESFDINSKDEETVLYRKIIESYNLNPDELMWVNSVACSLSDENKLYSKNEIKNCHIFLNNIIDSFSPLFIFCMGNTALRSFYDNTSLSDVHGKIIRINDIPSLATYSIEYLLNLKNNNELLYEQYKEIMFKDLENAIKYLDDLYPDSNLWI